MTMLIRYSLDCLRHGSAVVLLIACGCSDDSPHHVEAIPGSSPTLDAAAVRGLDAATDASTMASADAVSAIGDAGLSAECEVDALSFVAAPTPGRAFSAAIAGNVAHLAYVSESCGGAAAHSPYQQLEYVTVPTQGAASPAVIVANGGDSDCHRTIEPTVAIDKNGPRLFFTSDGSTGDDGSPSYTYDLFTRSLATAEVARQLTNTSALETGLRVLPSEGDAGVVGAYAALPSLPSDEASSLLVLNDETTSTELIASSANYHTTELALASIGGATGPSRSVLAWVSTAAAPAPDGVFLQSLDAHGLAAGPIQSLATQLGPLSFVDAAGQAGGAAVIYTVAPTGVHELRFRGVDPTGNLGSEVAISHADEDVLEASIASYSDGYVVAYRRSPGTDDTRVEIKLLFADARGTVSGRRFLTTATRATDLQVLVGQDGTILVLWSDDEAVAAAPGEPSGVQLRVTAARVRCL